jgi:dTDP-4-amino-4,6-dideoxygalactose transaminase
MIPYGRQSIDDADIASVVEVLKSDLITTGGLVEEFETELSDYLGAETFVVSSGTAALHCAYMGIGIQPGDEVITPSNTFIATQATAANLGAKIVFADLDPRTGLISLDSVKEKVTSRTKAIVLVDYAGQPCDIDAFMDFAHKKNIFVIEDAAHSLGSLYKGKRVGSLADITTFSFFPTKNITTGEGGAVSSKNEDLLKRAKRFGRQGLVRDSVDFKMSPHGGWHQEVHEFGLNYRLTDFQCALGLSQLSKIDRFKLARQEIFNLYKERLRDLQEIETLKVEGYAEPTWHLFPIFVNPSIRSKLFDFLRSKEIGVQVNYFPVHMQPVFQNLSVNDALPGTLNFYEREISLPMHLQVDETVIDNVVDKISCFLNEFS